MAGSFGRYGLTGVVFFGALLLFSLFAPDDGQRPVTLTFRLTIAGFWLAMVGLSIWLLNVSRRHVRVTAEGVEQVLSSRCRRRLCWGEISRIEAEDLNARLLLYNEDRSVRVELDYQLEDFPRLKRLVLDRVPTWSDGDRIPRRFDRSSYLSAISLVALWFWIAMTAIGCLVGEVWASFGCVFFFVFTLVATLREPVAVAVEPDGIRIVWPFRELLLSYPFVAGIDLAYARGPHASIHATVVLRLRHGKPLRLSQFKGGSMVLHAVLESAWRAVQKTDSDAFAAPES